MQHMFVTRIVKRVNFDIMHTGMVEERICLSLLNNVWLWERVRTSWYFKFKSSLYIESTFTNQLWM